MKFLFLLLIVISMNSWSSPRLEEIKAMIKTENIQTMEEFIGKLPDDLLKNYTLMHGSRSLHGSSFERPRAMLFNEKADWIVTFNGDESQAAGRMIEMMIYDHETKKYSFHEIEFADQVTVHENPTKCLACHGANPRPIWDHYNQWPGAYGDDDDRFNAEEYRHLQNFIEKAPRHPRYGLLKNLKENYRLASPGMRGGLTERAVGQPNRFLTMKLYQQRMKDIAGEMKAHSQFQTVKPLVLYFLTKCYLPESNRSYGDGSIVDPNVVMPGILKSLLNTQRPNYPNTFNPEHSLDYIFSRLGLNTTDWYLNSRNLSTYRVMKDGTDRTHEEWITLLFQHDEAYKDQYQFDVLDFQAIKPILATVKDKKKTCETLALESVKSIKVLEEAPPLPPNPGPSERGMEETTICRGFLNRECRTVYKTLPQICFKCHTQTPNDYGRVYIPFHELPSMVDRHDDDLARRMLGYIKTNYMPRRVAGDEAEYRQYIERDYPRLKTYLEKLIKREL